MVTLEGRSFKSGKSDGYAGYSWFVRIGWLLQRESVSFFDDKGKNEKWFAKIIN